MAVSNTVADARKAAAAASVVFAHSLLDEAVDDYLKNYVFDAERVEQLDKLVNVDVVQAR